MSQALFEEVKAYSRAPKNMAAVLAITQAKPLIIRGQFAHARAILLDFLDGYTPGPYPGTYTENVMLGEDGRQGIWDIIAACATHSRGWAIEACVWTIEEME